MLLSGSHSASFLFFFPKFFETGSLHVVLAILEVTMYIYQDGFELRDPPAFDLPSAGIKSVHHHI